MLRLRMLGYMLAMHSVYSCSQMNQQPSTDVRQNVQIHRVRLDVVFASLCSVPAFLCRVSEFRYMKHTSRLISIATVCSHPKKKKKYLYYISNNRKVFELLFI